ncbi:solute carrier family 2, facilitated glucose transporter member 12-like [Styela clava]
METEHELLIYEEKHSQTLQRPQVSTRKRKLNGAFRNKYILLSSVLATLGGILFGYDLGIISGALVQLQEYFQLSCFEQEMTIGSVIIGALLASLCAGFVVDYFGRKACIIGSSVLYAIGAIIVATSQSYNILICGRLILGTAIALSSASECIYVSEISPPKFRGTLVSFNELGITVGFLLAYCSNAAFAYNTSSGWRWMFGISLVLALAMTVTVCFLPYSPRYLLMKGRIEEAKQIHSQLQCNDQSSDETLNEWNAMKSFIYTSNNPKCNVCDIFRDTATRYSVFIGLSLMVIQQATGQPNLLFYASTVLVSFGFKANGMASFCSVGLGVAKLISTAICISIVEKYERKAFLIVGSLVMFVSLLIISCCAISFNIGVVDSCMTNHTNQTFNTEIVPGSEIARWVVLFSLIAFVSAYAFSFGPVSWIFLSEIFPTKVRGIAFSISTSLNWVIQLLLSMTFLDFSKVCGGVGWPFFINSLLTLMSVVFIYKIIPKTKGKTLEEIQEDLIAR